MAPSVAVLTTDEVRIYLQDRPDKNYLLSGLEFPDSQVSLAMDLAIDEFNSMPPPTGKYDVFTFPSKAVLLYGTCYHLLLGQSQLLARNTMEYSDGGTQIPVEERAPLYSQIASNFQSLFMTNAERIKVSQNVNSGWGSVASDESWFPNW